MPVKLRQARRSEFGPCNHFRAVDDGEEIVTPQTTETYRVVQTTGHGASRPTGIEMSDLIAPVQKKGFLQRARYRGVGDIIDFTAKRAERVHSPATPHRQKLHSPEKRASSGAPTPRCRFFLIISGLMGASGLWRPKIGG